MTSRLAICARFSRDEQNETSIDERRCRDIAPDKQAQLVWRLENNRRVRLITANGIDTDLPNWLMQVNLLDLLEQQSIRDTQHRVKRGMLNKLERGYFVTTPAFGYVYKREFDAQGNHLGTRWLIDEKEAALVCEIYARRESGESMHQIAVWLNADGVPCSRKATHGGFWRPARIRALLTNPIYRGIFHWHGSATYRNKAKKLGKNCEELVFPRPELRLVTDETWHRCNDMSGTLG